MNKRDILLVLVTLVLSLSHEKGFTQIIPDFYLSTHESIHKSEISNFYQPTNNSDSIVLGFESLRRDTVPKPKTVLMQSLILPGWGQLTNKQWWKVPIIYTALAGVGYYVYWLNGEYRDFRAAYYNSFASSNPDYADQRFGATPARLVGVPQSALLYYRNYYRNERDFMILMFTLTYGLNVIDAYIFAHLRDFDVSDDLSVSLNPAMNQEQTGFTLTLSF